MRDAEAWLAARGVERRPFEALSGDPEGDATTSGAVGVPLPEDEAAAVDDGRPDVSLTEARRLADEAPQHGTAPDPASHHDDVQPDDPGLQPPLEDAVSSALATARRITGGAPCSEGRLRRKLESRDLPDVVVERTLAAARAERLIDDDALAAALVAEWRAKGHAPRRIRDDLRSREFAADVVDRAVAVAEGDDQGAAAFALARERAERLRNVSPEAAYRRTASFLARRGYSEGLARKAARDAVYTDREAEQVAGR